MLENTSYVVSTKVQIKLVGLVLNELTVLLVHSQIFYFVMMAEFGKCFCPYHCHTDADLMCRQMQQLCVGTARINFVQANNY